MRGPQGDETTLLIDARGFAPEGDDCDATLAVKAYHLGWRHIVHYNTRGTRFHGVGFGPRTDGLRIDCYDNPGDYLASGIDGLEIYVHGNAQDQLCQIAKRGKLVVYGDVGQTFLYGAKGGDDLRAGQRRRPADDQRRRHAARDHQRHGAGLPGRVVHGRRSPHTAAASPSSTACATTCTASWSRWTCPIRAATCSRWPRAGRSTSAIRTARWSTSNSTAGPIARSAPPTGS